MHQYVRQKKMKSKTVNKCISIEELEINIRSERAQGKNPRHSTVIICIYQKQN